LNELINKYSLLQRAIYIAIEENKYNYSDDMIDCLDLLEQAEEEFGCELYNFLLEIQEGKEGFGEA
jgi:hypothetical protein